MQNNINRTNVLKELYSATNKTELSGDFILTDSLPDAKSVIHTSTSICRKNQYVGDGKITYDIEAVYDVLYADEENKIHCVKYRSDFSDSVSVKGCDADSRAVILTQPANTVIRLSNPRKFSIRCSCPMQIKVFSQSSPNENIGIIESDSVMVQTEEVPSMQVECEVAEGIASSQDITIPADLPEPAELLGVYLEPRITELRTSEGKAIFRGDIGTSVFYADANGEYHVYNTSFSVSQILPFDNATEDSECLGELFLYDITTESATDQDGKLRIVELDFMYDIRICCTVNTTSQVITDMYCLDRTEECEYKSVNIKSSAGIYKTNVSVNEKKPLEEKSVSRILLATYSAENCKCEQTPSGIVCTGEVVCDCAVMRGDVPANMSCAFPFKATLDIPSLPSDCEFTLSADCVGGKVKTDGENICCDAEIYISVTPYAVTEKKAVCSIRFGEPEVSEAILPLTLYYPLKGENIWNIAKKYRSTVGDIISANSLTGTDISDCRVLVIPKVRTAHKTNRR